MQAHVGTQRLTAAIDGHHVRVVAAADLEVQLPFVEDDDRTNRQAVRRDRREDDTAGLRHKQRTADGEIIGSTTRRRGDDQTVGMVGVQQLAVDLRLDGQHVRQTLLEDRYLVEGVGRQDQSLAGESVFVEHGEMQQTAPLDRIFARYEFLEDIIQVLRLHFGEESQVSAVHAEDRYVLVSYRRGGGQECTVTADRQREVDGLAIHVLRLCVSVPVLRKSRVLA